MAASRRDFARESAIEFARSISSGNHLVGAVFGGVLWLLFHP
jgi:hypothetical protein